MKTFMTIFHTISVMILFIIGLIICAILATFIYNLIDRIKNREFYKTLNSLSDDDYTKVLSIIDNFSPDISTASMLLGTNKIINKKESLCLSSHIGGTPYIELPDLVAKLKVKDKFILQIKVPTWMTESPWKNNLLVFFYHDKDIICIRYQQPDESKIASYSFAFSENKLIKLYELHVPRVLAGKKHRNIYAPKLLLKYIPALKLYISKLNKFPDKHEKFLDSILSSLDYDVEPYSLIQVGGCPRWIQHFRYTVPICPKCNKKMKFILQFGPELLEPDIKKLFIGTIYAFGCTKHLDEISCVEDFD